MSNVRYSRRWDDLYSCTDLISEPCNSPEHLMNYCDLLDTPARTWIDWYDLLYISSNDNTKEVKLYESRNNMLLDES